MSSANIRMFQKMPNLYEFLGLPHNCDARQIKKSFRSLTLIYHPDKSELSDAAEKFDLLKKATDILNNKEQRKEYDMFLNDLAEMEVDKAKMSDRRKKFQQELRKREQAYDDARKRQNTRFEASGQDKGSYSDFEQNLGKGKRTKNTNNLFEMMGQDKVNKFMEQEREDKKQLAKQLKTVVVKWKKASEKSYSKLLVKMIMRRFGVVIDLEMDPKYKKCFVEFEDFLSCDYAVKSFSDKDVEDLRVKYLIIDNREEQVKNLKNNGSKKIELSSQNLHKIAGAYNGYSYESRKQQVDREVKRQRIIADMLEKEKQDILNKLG